MTRPKLIYFDIAASRGEECRLALHASGVDFEDVRIKREDWAALKPTTPFGSLPVFEIPGRPPLAQSNAILALIGREHGLHPKDNFEAARHEAMMCHVEDLRSNVGPTMRIADEAEKKKAREGLVATYLPAWAERAERQIGDGPFFGGSTLNVVDIKIYMGVRQFTSGRLDYIPTTIFDGYTKLMGVYNAVHNDERIKAWYARG